MSASDDLALLRQEINDIDAELAHLAGKRAKIAMAVGRLKAEAGVCPVDEARELEVVQRFVVVATRAGYPSHEAWKLARELLRVCRGIVEEEVERAQNRG